MSVCCPVVAALLAACDENERHVRANLPHLPSGGGTFSVHAVRGIIARAEPACAAAETGVGQSAPSEPSEGASDALSPVPGPAERLRSAADALEQAAAKATPGRWEPEYGYLNRSRVQAVFVECRAEDGCDGVDCIDGTHGIGGFDLDGDNRWAILANPAVAAPLAALLRAEADVCEAWLLAADGDGLTWPVPTWPTATEQAFALAAVILGSGR